MSKYRRAIFRFDDFEDIDETWRDGSYIGGLASADVDAGIARQYRTAADLILSHSVKNNAVWEVVLPVDPGADAFRFTAGTKNKPHFLNEVWVQLGYLREVVAWIEAELEKAERLLSRADNRS